MLLEFGAFESVRTGEQWKEVHEHRLAALLPSGGRPRFGYIWYPRRVPDPMPGAGGDCEGAAGTSSVLEKIIMERLQEVAEDIDALPVTEEDALALEPSVEQELARLRLEYEQA
ncbi:hypothetical protein ACF06W_18445 [Streptomyces albus]|uniref:hypothetical protein n=1 Tax=Streptomyces albus TaxID=1888 RepID=UPI00370150C8